jgi:hypothetical protein
VCKAVLQSKLLLGLLPSVIFLVPVAILPILYKMLPVAASCCLLSLLLEAKDPNSFQVLELLVVKPDQ